MAALCRDAATLLPFFLTAAISLGAASDSDVENLTLRPPYAEMPPTFWEQYGVRLVISGILLLALAGLLVWLLSRPRPPLLVPPEVQARQALDSLRMLPENGATLSRISQVLRHYFAAVFALPTGELTTVEFCRAIAAQEQVGGELATAVADFLQRCDEQKFAPPSVPPQIGSVARALALVGLAEARRASLRQNAAVQAANPSAGTG